MTDATDEYVDLGEAAERHGLARSTLKMYLHGTRHDFGRFNVGFPLPDFYLGNKPAWRWSTIDMWARESERGKYRFTKET